MNIVIDTLQKLPSAARDFKEGMNDSRIIAFYGTMGAGKTTFIKALCREFGSTDNITSPSFAIVNEYTSGAGTPIYHFDFYRIRTVEEVYDLGYEEYFYSGHLCLIEWPELIEELLPADAMRIAIEVLPGGQRLLTDKRR